MLTSEITRVVVLYKILDSSYRYKKTSQTVFLQWTRPRPPSAYSVERAVPLALPCKLCSENASISREAHLSQLHPSFTVHKKADNQNSSYGHNCTVQKSKRWAEGLPEGPCYQTCWKSDGADDEVIRSKCSSFEM